MFRGCLAAAERYAVLMVVAIGASFVTASTRAERSFRQCDAVSNMADLRFDSRMMVNVFKDTKNKICTFEVFLPPTRPGQPQPAEQAALIYQSILRSQSGAATAVLSDAQLNSFVDPLLSALTATLLSDRTPFNPDAKLLADVLYRKDREVIASCARDAVAGRPPVTRRSDFVTCGVEPNGAFVLQAALPNQSLSVTLVLPAAT